MKNARAPAEEMWENKAKRMRITDPNVILDCDILIECGVCHVIVPNRERMRMHMKLHSGRICYTCTKCDFVCFDGVVLSKHYEVHDEPYEAHEEPKRYRCAGCGWQVTQLRFMKDHICVQEKRENDVRQQGQENSYCCNECGMTTKSLLDIRDHFCEKQDHFFDHNELQTFTVAEQQFDAGSSNALQNDPWAPDNLLEMDDKNCVNTGGWRFE